MWDERAVAGKRAALCFCKSKLTVEAVQRLALLAYKERLAGRFHPGTHALTALSSSLRRGCVVDKPSFNRATCNTRLSVSTWSRFNSRASFLLSLVTSINRSTSREVRCFRSLTSPTPPPVFPGLRCLIRQPAPDQVIKEADLQDPRAGLKGEKLDA